MADVAEKTTQKLLVDAGRACNKFHRKVVHNVEVRGWVEADELWNFIYCKENNLQYAIDPPWFSGDCWTHIALDSHSKLIISYLIGKRKPSETKRLLEDVKKRVAGGSPPITTDGYIPYRKYAPKVFGKNVSFANVIGTRKYRISGNPDMKRTGTTFVERHNLTMRTNIRRYTRKTNAFSKKVSRQRMHVHLHVVWYNFCRIHQSLQCSPAMEAELTDTLHDMNLIVDLIEADALPPNRPKKYRKRKLQT